MPQAAVDLTVAAVAALAAITAVRGGGDIA